MAASFTLEFNGRRHVVARHFLLGGRSIKFGQLIPASLGHSKGKPQPHFHRLPCSPQELLWFPENQAAFEAAAKEVDNNKLIIPADLIMPGAQRFRTIGELRKHATEHGTAKGQAKCFNEASKALTGLNEPQLVGRLRRRVVEEFHALFDRIQLHDPAEFGAPRFLFGNNLFAEAPDREALAALADQGHTYAQYLSALLAASTAGALTNAAVEYLLAAHAQKFPKALPALAERLLLDAYYGDALQCAVMAVAGGYGHAASVVDDVARETAMAMLETREGMVPFFPHLVEHVMEREVREFLLVQRPDWRPRTHDQILEAMFRRQIGGRSNV